MGSKNYPLRRIRYWYCYDLDEIVALYNDKKLHIQTIRAWLKNGLTKIDNSKPILIYGSDLIKFLENHNAKNKYPLEFHQFFCFSCNDVKTAFKKQIYIHKQHNILLAKAVCCDCKTTMNKTYKLDDYQQLQQYFNVVQEKQLYDCLNPPSTTHLNAPPEMPLNESPQIELFK